MRDITKEQGDILKNKTLNVKSFRVEDLTNKKFNYLLAIGYLGNYKWLCQCECGNYKIVLTGHLKNDNTRSCGCKKVTFKTHGLTKTRVYKIWQNMKDRCYREDNINYHNYGGKGITVCDRWKDSFENFLEDMGTPTKLDTLDRIKVEGNYEPSNCKWSTMKEQQNNRSNNRIITFRGETNTLAYMCEKYNLNYFIMYNRIIRQKWKPERAFLLP